MRRFHDDEGYDVRQERLVREIVDSIKSALASGRLKGARLRALTEDIAFAVTSAVDGATYMELGDHDDHLVPLLGFAEGRMRNRLLVPEEGGSSLHEFVPGVVAEAFGA